MPILPICICIDLCGGMLILIVDCLFKLLFSNVFPPSNRVEHIKI